MDKLDRLLHEQACRRLYTDFAYTVDNHQVNDTVQLFTKDGVFNRLGVKVSGHKELYDFFSSRDTENKSHHICTNIRIRFISSSTAIGTCTVMLFTPGGNSDNCKLAQYNDSLLLTSDGWRIQQRTASLVF